MKILGAHNQNLIKHTLLLDEKQSFNRVEILYKPWKTGWHIIFIMFQSFPISTLLYELNHIDSIFKMITSKLPVQLKTKISFQWQHFLFNVWQLEGCQSQSHLIYRRYFKVIHQRQYSSGWKMWGTMKWLNSRNRVDAWYFFERLFNQTKISIKVCLTHWPPGDENEILYM